MAKVLINEKEMERMLERLAFQAIETSPSVDSLCIVGIHRRGVHLAKRIQAIINKHKNANVCLGTLDITLYRDDLSEHSDFPTVYGTELPFDISGKTIILVDDVIYTGRTTRAAIEAIVDYGRPAKIVLLAMIDRGHRELPIQPDLVGKVIPTSKKELIHVHVKELDGDDSVVIEAKK